MAVDTKFIPEGYNTLNVGIVVRGAAAAIAFYQRAFGAEERARMEGPGGSIMHAELRIGNSILMLSDEMQGSTKAVQAYGGSPVWFYLYVEDADAAIERAERAGAEVTMPVADQFWGDRMGEVTDPYGLRWCFATHTKELSEEEMRRGQESWLREHGASAAH